MKTRLVKITERVTNIYYYQIQTKTLLFGWIGIDNKKNNIKGTFYVLEEAIKEYECFTSKKYFDIEIIK